MIFPCTWFTFLFDQSYLGGDRNRGDKPQMRRLTGSAWAFMEKGLAVM